MLLDLPVLHILGAAEGGGAVGGRGPLLHAMKQGAQRESSRRHIATSPQQLPTRTKSPQFPCRYRYYTRNSMFSPRHLLSACVIAARYSYVASGFSSSRLLPLTSGAGRSKGLSSAARYSSVKMTAAASYPSIAGKNLVSVQDCIDAYNHDPSGIVFVDGSWYHRSARSGRSEFEAGPRIKGARYVDMDDICAKGPIENAKNLPHMMPSKELFAAAMDAFDISNDDHVVVYGNEGCVFTPRTWFLFQQSGHDQSRLSLMQGSMEEWIERGGPVEEGPANVPKADEFDLTKPTKYQARDPPNIIGMQVVLEAVRRQESYILDPRGTTFAKAHMPGAINIPYRDIVTDEDLLKFKPREELQRIFRQAGVDPNTDRKVILTCGSGVSVCHLWLSLEECGRNNSEGTLVYDGSWSEYGADESTPKVSSSDQ